MKHLLRLALVSALALGGLELAGIAAAGADVVTGSYDSLRTGWDRDEATLNSGTVGAPDFGRLFSTQLDGQVYAQPVVADNTVLVTTENDKVYGLNPVTGAVRWTRDVGPAWAVSAIGCGDLVPNIGSTSTPVVDAATHTAYFTAKVDDGPDPQHPHWYLHRIDIRTGVEQAGFPTTIAGAPSNDPSHAFNPFTAMQRPGLLLLGGVVYAGFASHCDHGPYVGYVVGVNATSGALTTMWSTEGGSARNGAGIWQGGGGLVSDGNGRIIVATGNGVSPAPGPGTSPPSTLAESVVRLAVTGSGNLQAKDYFSPVNNSVLDRDDSDLGSGGPMAIPDGYGTSAHPHLLVEVGKDGRVFLLDRDHLGGTAQGPGGGDDVLQTAGPFNGVWGHPAFWGAGTGYVYLIENSGPLRAYQLGVSGTGMPALTSVATSDSNWGYTSGSPIVTSDGTTAGSALVWAVYSSGSSGARAELRAYDATPTGDGRLTLRYSAPIGTASKFSVPTADAGRVYVGTRDGRVLGFGRPVAAALNAQPTDFGTVDVGQSGSATITVTATRDVTITGIGATSPFAVDAPNLPVTVRAGEQLQVSGTYRPTATGVQTGTVDFTTDAGSFQFTLNGKGATAGLGATPADLSYGQVPVGGRVVRNVSITNTGRAAVTISEATGPTGAFTAAGLPVAGSRLGPGASVAVSVTFRPGAAGDYNSQLSVTSDAGGVTVPLSGAGVAGTRHLSITPTSLNYGAVRIGQTRTLSFDIANTGNLALTITKAAPPAAPFVTSTPVSEGQQLEPGDVIHQAVTFRPTGYRTMTGVYQITANDGRGAQSVKVAGRGNDPLVTVRSPASGGWRFNGVAKQQGSDTVLTGLGDYQAGDAVYPSAMNPVGLHVRFTAQLGGGGVAGADGLAFGLLDAAASNAKSLGKSAGSLGFAGMRGVAVALDTYRNGGEPSANFAGIAVSGAGSRTDQMPYVATKALTSSLRTGTHVVDILVTAGRVQATIDGTEVLAANVALPKQAYLAFTGSTGGLDDVHTVRAVTITRPPAVGKVLGLAGRCLSRTVQVGRVGRAALAACTTPAWQTWVVQNAGTLTARGQCLSVVRNATADGSGVEVTTCNRTRNQVWTPLPSGLLRNAHANRCLFAPTTARTRTTALVIKTCSTKVPGERWKLPS